MFEPALAFFLIAGFCALLRFADAVQSVLSKEKPHIFGPKTSKFISNLGIMFVIAAGLAEIIDAITK